MLTILFLIIYTLSLYNIYRNDLSEITLLNRNTFVKRDIYFFMIVILLMIIMGGVTSNPDYFNYKDIYVNKFQGMEIGYSLLMSFSRFLGLSYESFRISITILGFTSLIIGIQKFKIDKLSFFLIYFIYPFPYDTIQIRNFLLMAILFLAISFFICESNIKKKYIYYYVFVLAGFLIQKMGAIYFLFPFFLIIMNSKKLFRKYIIGLIGLSFIMFYQDFFIVITNILNIKNDTLLYYLTERKVRYGFFLFWILTLLIFLSTYIIGRVLEKNKDSNKKIESKILTNFIYFSMIFTPLYTIDLSFWRLMRNAIPIYFVLFLKFISSDSNLIEFKKYKKIINILTFILMLLILFIENRLLLKDTIIPMFFKNKWI